jgi:hypothetical protein
MLDNNDSWTAQRIQGHSFHVSENGDKIWRMSRRPKFRKSIVIIYVFFSIIDKKKII